MNHVAVLFALFALASCAGAPQVNMSSGKPAASATLESQVLEIAGFRL